MKRLIPALLLAAAVQSFAAAAPLKTKTVPAPKGFPFSVETQILSEDSYQVKITDKKTGKVQTIEDLTVFSGFIEGNAGDLATIRDYNGDGHPDIAVRVIGGYTLPADELYLFDPATRPSQPVPPGLCPHRQRRNHPQRLRARRLQNQRQRLQSGRLLLEKRRLATAASEQRQSAQSSQSPPQISQSFFRLPAAER